ncbi:MAG: sulfurtransferase [Chitinophagaceae bacterium]|nr:sulfurtransferase [Chitinophagaceae bacterium]
MKKISLFILVFIISVISKSQQPVIVSPQWLNENLKDPSLVILYTGFVIRDDYDKEHIEGSRFLWPEWLAFNKPEGNMFAPDPKTATRVLQDLGINKDSKIVICHRGADVTIAARMFMTLEHFGLNGKVSFLSGGMEAWKRAGFPVTDKAAVFKKGNIELKEEGALVNKEYVLNALSTTDKVVVDARMKRWYDGDPTGNPRDGHISGALNIPYPDMIDSTNSFKPVSILEKNFTTVVPDRMKEVVVYCFIGQTACVDYVVGRDLGYKMKVYEGSMQEWSRDAKLPMEKLKKE